MDNAKMEKDMTAGVKTFLDYAEKYASGDLKTGNRPLRAEGARPTAPSASS